METQFNNHPEAILVSPNADALTKDAAKFVVESVREAIELRGRASLALSGGSQKPAELIRPAPGRLTWLLDEPSAHLRPVADRR